MTEIERIFEHFGGSAEYNICISDAQYYESGVQQNLWCEILEFWAFIGNVLTHSMLYGFLTKHYEIRLAKEPFFAAIEPLLHSNTAIIVIQQSLFHTLIVALSDCKRGCIVKRVCRLHSKTP